MKHEEVYCGIFRHEMRLERTQFWNGHTTALLFGIMILSWVWETWTIHYPSSYAFPIISEVEVRSI